MESVNFFDFMFDIFKSHLKCSFVMRKEEKKVKSLRISNCLRHVAIPPVLSTVLGLMDAITRMGS